MSNFHKLKLLIENSPNPKIVICGNSGSGKSTLGKIISKVFAIPHIETDLLRWLPDWKWRAEEEFKELLNIELQKPSWVIDDAGARLVSELVKQATVVIWLDVPVWGSLLRVMKRSVMRRHPKHRSPIGQERIGELVQFFPYILRYNKERRPVLQQHVGNHPYMIQIRTWKEVVTLMKALQL